MKFMAILALSLSDAVREIIHLNLSPGYMESPGTDQSEFQSLYAIFQALFRLKLQNY